MKVLCVTGTRADYGIYKPLLEALHKDPDLELNLMATGMHLIDEYGRSMKEIEKDSFPIVAQPNILLKGDGTDAMSQSIGIALLAFSDHFRRLNPDWVIVLGDRGEMLAASIAAHYQNIGIVHLHGGEMSGSADDAVRHMISKLAHLHFVATRQSQRHLQYLGEEKRRIIPVGSLRKIEIKKIQEMDQKSIEELQRVYGLKTNRSKLLFVMHPDSKDEVNVHDQIRETIRAIEDLHELDILIIGPNSDAGGELFRTTIQTMLRHHPHSTYFSNVPSEHYLFLLSQVDLMVGNSSSGIIEAPFLKRPFVHVGQRQRGREHGDNVFFVPFDAAQIRVQIERVLNQQVTIMGKNPYDLGLQPQNEIVRQFKRLVQLPWVKQKYGISFHR